MIIAQPEKNAKTKAQKNLNSKKRNGHLSAIKN